jgi:hypothetical protein
MARSARCQKLSGSSGGYLGALLRLTLLAPDIVESIPDGRRPEDVTLPWLLEPLPLNWSEQSKGGASLLVRSLT